MDVAQWLNGVGLGQYEKLFREHEIDADVLTDLTEADLEKIGVPLGHRKRLMRAIAAILPRAAGEGNRPQGGGGGERSAREEERSPSTMLRMVPLPRGAGEDHAERRPITVMFCDLVGSTGLAAKLDAEDWRNLVGAYLDAASAAVSGLGGHVLKKLGDGLMALFGYPQAQENDAERAVRAAVAIQRSLADLNARNAGRLPELAARIGLDSGPVVVDATGEVFGEAPNVAARVQGAAEPGAVVVTANVHRQVAGLFVAEDKGAHAFKGVPKPVTLYRIVRASGGGRRGGARALTPLVGREEELNLLSRRWERALKGEGQLALVVGEPGIGKSRLIEEFRAKLGETPHTFVEWSSSQLLQNTPLHPIAEWGRQRFAEPSADPRLADLESTLSLIGLDAAEYAPLLAPLVDVPLPEDRAAKYPPEELRRRQMAALVAWVLAGARSQAVALAFEDLHWADPTTLDLMRALAERGGQAPLFIIATARPEFRAPWSLRSHHSVIALSPLDRAEVARMVGELGSRHALSKDVIDGVSERTGGVPLFVEEVTRLLLERGVEGGAQAIPPTLQQSLAARLDRLGEAREVAQIGAVLGRNFSYALLRAVAAVDDRSQGLSFPSSAGEGGAERRMRYGPLPQARVGLHERQRETASSETCSPHPIRPFGPPSPLRGEGGDAPTLFPVGTALESALEKLIGADLLHVEGVPPQSTYRFKHALIQDAAYDSLLRSRRQALHKRAAEALRESNAEPEAIAHHFTEAGLDDLAIEWWGKAGDQALRRSAFQEAIAHLGKAIAMADKATGAKAADASGAQARLQVAYGNALFHERGMSAPETTEAFAKAGEMAHRDKDASERLAADYGLWAGSIVRGELSAAREHSMALLNDAEAKPESPEASVAHRIAGTTHWFAGEYREARERLERALTLFQPSRDDDLAFRFGQDTGAAAMFFLALVLWPLGDVDGAASLVAGAQARTAGLAHIGTHAYANLHAAMFAFLRGDLLRAAQHGTELGRLSSENDLQQQWPAVGVFFNGLTKATSGRLGEGLVDMRHGAELLRQQNILVWDGLIKIALADAETQAGDPNRALAVLDEALATCERTGHRAFEAELHRVRGEMLVKRDPTNLATAEEALQTAIAVAKRQVTRSFELRAALALAKLYQSTGRPVEAHAVLAPALEGFARLPSPSGRRAGDEGYRPDDEGPEALTPDPSPGRERGGALAAELPEIAEAQALLAALGETDEAKTAAEQRQRRLGLQTSYGKALMWGKGFVAEEAKTAFARAQELAGPIENKVARFVAYDAEYLRSAMRGEFRLARKTAEAYLREAEAEGRAMEASMARRALGVVSLFRGDLELARSCLEQALADRDSERDAEARLVFGRDPEAGAAAFLAVAVWHSGQVERARQLINRAIRRAEESGHAASIVQAHDFQTVLESHRDDVPATLASADNLLRLAQNYGISVYAQQAQIYASWAQGRLLDPDAGQSGLKQAIAAYTAQGNKIGAPSFHGLLAELEAMTKSTGSALMLIDDGLRIAQETGEHWTDPYLHRLRGEILLKRESADSAPAEEAYQTAIAIAKDQGARSYELLASLSLAKLYQSTARPADAHAVLAPALEGFAPTPEMPEIAEAQALLMALAEIDEVRADATREIQRRRLQVAYGNALLADGRRGAPEIAEVFSRARVSAQGQKGAPEQLAAYYGLWSASIARGDLASMRTEAAAFLADVAATPDSPEAGVAHRAAGVTHWYAGEYGESRDHLERALALFQPGRDDDLAFRFVYDPGVAAMASLADASWPLGDVGHAISLIERMLVRSAGLALDATIAFANIHAAMFELLRGDISRAAPHAVELARLAREHEPEFALVRAFATFLEGATSTGSGGLEAMRSGAELLREQNFVMFDGLIKIALAEAQARAGDIDCAVVVLDEALAASERIGHRTYDAELHRIRGEMLLKRDPANPVTAEEELETAIAVAKRQGTRSFELRAALALAKLYQSTGGPVEAHATLASALEGFAHLPSPSGRRVGDEGYRADDGGPRTLTPDPSPERERGDALAAAMPEIAEAQALLAALAESDEVKAEAELGKRRQRLQVSYGNALIAARGFGATETTEAFSKAREAAPGERDAPERLAADFGLWAGSYTRGELPAMRAHAAAFLADIQARPDSPEAGVAYRAQGITCWFAGEYFEARQHLERALALFQPGRDDELAYRFGMDPGVPAMAYLAIVLWSTGEVDRALPLVERMRERIAGLTHANTLALGAMHACAFELMRGNRSSLRTIAHELVRIVREHDLRLFRAFGVFFEGWLIADRGAATEGLASMRRGVESLREQNVLVFDGVLKVALADAEARAGDLVRALALLDEALATVERSGYRAYEAELHRVRGEMLLKRDPNNPAAAEEALQTAIGIAREQGTRSFGLRAALSLAKLYQSSARPVEAHAVLAPTLEGMLSLLPFGRRAGDEDFAGRNGSSVPSPPAPLPGERGEEMPEIAEARALLDALAKDERVREALEKRRAHAKMHVDYARAVQWAKGWGAEEARAAVERAHELAAPTPSHPDYWSLTYGRFAVSLLRGEFRAALEIAETYLRQAQVEGRPDHAVNARRLLATVKFELGALFDSRQEFEKLLADWDENRDKALRAVTGADVLCVGCAYMAQLLMTLGEVDEAIRISEGAIRRAESLGDFGSLAFASGLSLFVLAMCGRIEATLRRAEAFEAAASEKGARLWESIAKEWASWARGLVTGEAAAAATELRDIMAARRERQELQSAYMGHGVFAQLQGRAGAIGDALTSIAEGLALAAQTGGHRADSFLHRVRGDILAERDPAAAEAAYREALRIAHAQGARTFELQAAHALARLLKRAARPAEAYAVLAPALEAMLSLLPFGRKFVPSAAREAGDEGLAGTDGSSAPSPPTPLPRERGDELAAAMPEIAGAQALLAELAEMDEVKSDAARRERRLRLQTAYGQTVMDSKGFASEER